MTKRPQLTTGSPPTLTSIRWQAKHLTKACPVERSLLYVYLTGTTHPEVTYQHPHVSQFKTTLEQCFWDFHAHWKVLDGEIRLSGRHGGCRCNNCTVVEPLPLEPEYSSVTKPAPDFNAEQRCANPEQTTNQQVFLVFCRSKADVDNYLARSVISS